METNLSFGCTNKEPVIDNGKGLRSSASNSDVISLTSSDEDEKEDISGSSRIKKFKKGPVDIVPQVSLTPVRRSPNNVILLDSDDEGPKNDESSNENGTPGKENSRPNKNKVKNPLNAILKKNGITVRQKGEVVSLVIDSDSDNTDIEKNERKHINSDKEVCRTNDNGSDNDEYVKNEKINKGKRKRRRCNGTQKDSTKVADVSMRSHDETTESIVIDDSDEDTEKENHCENDIEPFSVNIEKTSTIDAATTQEDEARILFKKFLKIVEEKIVDSSFEEVLPKKVPIIEKYFKKCGKQVNENKFKHLLSELISNIQTSQNTKAAKVAVLAIHKVFEHLKALVADGAIIIEHDHYPKVKKMEKTIELLKKKIKQLDEAEIDINDENDTESSYIMVDKYLARLNKVYAKYCQYLGRNPNSGLGNDKIYYVNSKHNAINRALTKKYGGKHTNSPCYLELKKFIEKVAKKENLNLSELELRRESESCFQYLGDLKQKKRRHELYALHLDTIEFTEDPAANDSSLENVLKKNYTEGRERIDKIFELYVKKQDEGEDYESAHEGESSEESDVEKVDNNEEDKNEGSGVEKPDENKENKGESTKMDKGKSLMNGTKTVKKKSKQITVESNELPTTATDVGDKVEEKTDVINEEIEMTVNNNCEDDNADTSLKEIEDAMELD